jgi:predicted unusual protein kinase regulating ubiquinone biosynthesis (AarF/ABC1/UbiB family)
LDWHSYEPIKAGMISLVFKLCDETNKKLVILKMKRKNIDSKLNKAIDYLQFFVYIVSFIPYFNTFDIASTFNKNIETLKQQLDFNQEVQNMREAEDKCKNLKYVKIPQVYDEVTNKYPTVIMMEFIEGNTIQEIVEEDYSEYAGQLLKYGMASFLIHGVTHGDLHAGNILFLKDENTQERKICLIDFGIVLRIEDKIRTDFLKTASNMFTSPAREISRDLICMYLEPVDVLKNLPNNHFERMLDKMESIIEETIHSKNQADQTKLYQCIIEINTYINNNNLSYYGLKFNDSFVKTQMALAMCNGINMVLCKNDYMTFANKTINELFHTDLFKDN